jgi:2-oxoglutarate dehydrogenase E1 component
VYYELLRKRTEAEVRDVAILRLEQLYPFDTNAVNGQLRRYPQASKLIWCQEEPLNQGAWYQIRHRLQQCLQSGQDLMFAGRVACSAPAGGSPLRHNQREQMMIHDALGLEVPEMN